MSRPSQRSLFAVAVCGLVSATVSACGTAARPGAAATIGTQRISISQLASLTDAAVATNSGVGRQTLQTAILRELIQERVDGDLAAKLGVSVSDLKVRGEISQLEAQAGGNDADLEAQLIAGRLGPVAGSGAAGLVGYIRDSLEQQAISTELAKNIQPTTAALMKLYQQNISRFITSHIAVIECKDKPTADSVLAKLKADPKSFADVAKKQSIDTQSAVNGGDLGQHPKGYYLPAIEDAIFAAKPGDIVGPIMLAGGASLIVHVIDVQNTSFEEALPQLQEQASNPSGPVVQAALKGEQSQQANRLGVWINPRFGSWGSSQFDIQAAPNPLSRPGAPSSSDQAAAGGTLVNPSATPIPNPTP